jgi:hypothetical protein
MRHRAVRSRPMRAPSHYFLLTNERVLGRTSPFCGESGKVRNRRVPAGHGRIVVRQELPHTRRSQCPSRSAQLGGSLPLAPGVSTVRYPIPERIFDYVSTVRSATAGTCHKPKSSQFTFSLRPRPCTLRSHLAAVRRSRQRCLGLGHMSADNLANRQDFFMPPAVWPAQRAGNPGNVGLINTRKWNRSGGSRIFRI